MEPHKLDIKKGVYHSEKQQQSSHGGQDMGAGEFSLPRGHLDQPCPKVRERLLGVLLLH